MGFSHGILEPAWDAVYAERLSEKEECKTWSMWTGTTNLAIGVAAILGSLIVSKYSFNSLFIIMTIFCALSTLISLRILRKVKRKN
jgi:predicted MFS family arabinose efflux permease